MLYSAALGKAVEEGRQYPLVYGKQNGLGNIPGGSIVRLCPESRDTDVLAIERMVNRTQVPILYGPLQNSIVCLSMTSDLIGVFRNEEIDVYIWGNYLPP